MKDDLLERWFVGRAECMTSLVSNLWLSAYVHDCPSACLFNCLSSMYVFLSVYLPVRLSVICVGLNIAHLVCLCVYLSYSAVCLLDCLSVPCFCGAWDSYSLVCSTDWPPLWGGRVGKPSPSSVWAWRLTPLIVVGVHYVIISSSMWSWRLRCLWHRHLCDHED